MGSRLKDETEMALGRVLQLVCNSDVVSVTQQDFDALERHDEAALALLDINEDEAAKVCRLVWFLDRRGGFREECARRKSCIQRIIDDELRLKVRNFETSLS